MVVLTRLLALFALVLCVSDLSAQQVDTTFWAPNGPVNSLVLRDSTVIIGGNFDQIAPVVGSFVKLDTTTAFVDPNRFKVFGNVYASVRDSAGYIYIGGRMYRAGNSTVNSIFRIKPDGTFDESFVHDVSGTVYCLVIHDTDLFIGGEFTSIDGEYRSNFGGIALNTGLVNLCDPQVNGPVYCMDLDPGNQLMVIGGDFNQVSGFHPPFLTKIMLTTGAPITSSSAAWTSIPNTNGPVYDVKCDGFRVFIAGEFTMFASIQRRGIAAILGSDGSLLPYDAQVVGSVYSMEFADSSLYIGGNFTSVRGQARANIANVDRDFNLTTWWNPGANGTVRTIIQIDKRRLFVGGDFSTFGGDTCGRGAILMKSTVIAIPWDPQLNSTVYTAVMDTSQQLYIGGEFYCARGLHRKNLCALSTNTGTVTAWNPVVNAPVQTMTLAGDTLFFAGDFTNVNSTARGRVAAIDLNTEALLPFNPVVNGLVRTIAVTATDVYVGGNFTLLGGQPRFNIGKVDRATGALTPWSPVCSGSVNSILVDDYWVYVAGYYSTIAGVGRSNLARLDPGAASVDLNWVCETDDGIYHAEFNPYGQMVLCGWFTSVNGQSSPQFAIVDTTSLQLQPNTFGCDGYIRTFTSFGDDYFLSGDFELVNAQYQPRLVAFDSGNNALDPWSPFPNAMPLALQATANRLFVGGPMTISMSRFHPYLQVLDVQWVTGMDENPAVDQSIHIWPNPATDFVTVSSDQSFSAYTITDLTGNVVRTGNLEFNSREQLISVSGLATGLYVLNLSTDAGFSCARKILIGE